jgi:ribosomal protein S1
VILENNIRGKISKQETDRSFVREKDWSRGFKVGQNVKAKIRNINFKTRIVNLSIN